MVVYVNIDRYGEGLKRGDAAKVESDTIAITDLYLIHYEKRGNVFINEEGKRITGTRIKNKPDATRLYLIKREQIQAYNLAFHGDSLTYRISKPNANQAKVIYTIPLSEVFLVKYPDGTSDLVNDLSPQSKQEVAVVEEKPVIIPVQEQTIYHSVKRGETLQQIADRYDVSIDDVRKWNKLKSTIKPNSRLRTGLKLEIHVIRINN